MQKRAVSALVATVLLILVTVAAVSIIWGAVMPMINKATQYGQSCTNARLNIDTTSGYTCYDSSKKQVSVMISRGAQEFELAGMQIGLASGEQVKSYTLKKEINLLKNGDFELWSAGVSSAPDGWAFATVGGGTITRSNDKKIGIYSASIRRGTSYADLYQDFHTEKGIAYWQGRTASLSCWVKTSVSGSAYLRLKDGVGLNSVSHTGSGNWELLTVTRTIDNAATYAKAICDVNVDSDTAYCDGCMLVEGTNAVIWEENTIYGELPNQNEARTYKFGVTDEITEARVAPIVRIGNREKICEVTSKMQVPRCA